MRVPLNISIPSEEAKQAVLDISNRRGKSPSEEFVELYKKLAKKEGVTFPQ